MYSVRKVIDFPTPSRDVTYQTLLAKLFPARECLVSDIPAGDGKIANLFYSVGKDGHGNEARNAQKRARTYITILKISR